MITILQPFTLHALLDNEIRSDKGNVFTDAIEYMDKYIKSFLLNIPLLLRIYYFFNNNKLIYLQYGLNYNFKLLNIENKNKYTDNYIIYPINISNHAICIILDHINKLLIVVNTGYQINYYHKKINNDKYYPFLIFNKKCYTTFSSNIKIIKNNTNDNNNQYIIIRNINNLYNFLHYINNNDIVNIFNINQQINSNDYKYEYDNSNDKLLEKFNKNSVNQVSGSCTFYSLYMSLYYILSLIDKNYDDIIIEFKKYIINYEIKNIKDNLIIDENNIEYLKIINRKYDNILIDKIKKYYNNIEENKIINPLYKVIYIDIKNNNELLKIEEQLYNIYYINNEKLINYQKPIMHNNLFDLLYLINILNNSNYKQNINSYLIELNFEDILNNSINQTNNYNNPLLFIYYIYYILFTTNSYYAIIYLIKYLENENINYKLDENNFKLSIMYIFNILYKLYNINIPNLEFNIKSYLLLFLLKIFESNNIFMNLPNSITPDYYSSYNIIINNYNIKNQLSILLNKYYLITPSNNKFQYNIRTYIIKQYKNIIYHIILNLLSLFNKKKEKEYDNEVYDNKLSSFYYNECPYITVKPDKTSVCKYVKIDKLFEINLYEPYYENMIFEYIDIKVLLEQNNIEYTYLDILNNIDLYYIISVVRTTNYIPPNIYNFPKLLKNRFAAQQSDINIKINYNETLLLPFKIESINEYLFLPSKIVNDNDTIYKPLLYSHYIDKNDNYYEYERNEFIDSFNILDDIILNNTNYILLLMNIYMQCYYFNYIDNDNFLKLKNFLIRNVELLKTINENYIYYFDLYYNINIQTICDKLDDGYIIFKCNDILKFHNNISITDIKILNISINDNKYIYKNIYYRNLNDTTFLEINNIKLYIFTNNQMEKIAIHPDFPDLYIDNDKYYINYQDKKYELDNNIHELYFFKNIYKFKDDTLFYTNYINNNKKIEFYINPELINGKYKIILSLNNIDKTIKYFIYKKDDNVLLVQDIITNDYYIIIYNNFNNKCNESKNNNNYFNNQELLYNNIKYEKNINEIKYLFVKLIKINDIYIPEITDNISAIFVLFICNFYMDYTIINFIYNKCKLYIDILLYDLICGPFTNFYKKINNKYIQQNIESYYNDYKTSDSLTFIEKMFYYPSVSINYNKKELQIQFIEKIKYINNITSDNIFKELSDSITQETIINNMKNKNNKVYELLMGSGKSKFIIPYYLFFTKYIDAILDESIDLEYFYKDNIFKIVYDEYMIITPSHLVNSMSDILLEFIYILPKNITFKKIIFNNKSEYIFNKNQIIVIDDTTLKYNLLINSNEIINKNRLLIIDEIDDLINPLKSEFNLLIDYGNELPQKEILLEFIYDLILKYNIKGVNIRQYIFNLKLNNITNFTKCYFKSTSDKMCDDENVENQVFYLIKKILDTIKQTDELILNKHYGLSFDDKEESYYFAQPYAGLNLPIKNSYFNDYILTLILTTIIFINTTFKLRQNDYLNIINLIYKSKDDIIKQKLNNKTLNEVLIIIIDEVNKNKEKYIKLYLLNFILPNIKYLNKYKNTSFIEILNPKNYQKLIGFTGTIELIERFNPKFLKTNKLLSFYKIEELKEIGNKNLTSTTNIIQKYIDEENLIKDLLNLDEKYKVIIDNGSYLKDKLVIEYVNLFLEKYDSVVYFNENHEPKIIDKSKNEIDYKLELLKDNYLIFFDVNHCRGTDIKIPDCNGIVTLNKFNNLVDTLQSIYRLRRIGNGQNIDYYYTNIDEKLTKDNIFEYLKKKLDNDLHKSYKDFLIHNINSLKKFESKYYENYEINSFMYPKNKISLNDIKKKDLQLEDTFNKICKIPKLNCKQLKILITTNVHSINVSTNISTNVSTNVSANISTNISSNITILKISDKKYDYIIENNIIKIPINMTDYYNKYTFNGRDITLYEYYIINKLTTP
jgi:hypothetical protein